LSAFELSMTELHVLEGAPRQKRSASDESRAPDVIVAVAILIGAEVMFFGGLITALLVLRASAVIWPPPGQPRLPLLVTGLNTVVLLISGFAMRSATFSLEANRLVRFKNQLTAATALGAAFVIVQGYEWFGLLRHGLKVAAGVYGGLFGTIVLAHSMHVAAGLIALAVVGVRAARGRYTPQAGAGVNATMLYWSFVVMLWPVLYVLVYLI
jgi:cytochrome c oxidase subunit III